MYILTIETTGPIGSVAITDTETNRTVYRCSDEPMNHLKELMPMAKALTEELHIVPSDIGAVAASVGPGSFTGIRIGVASARAVSQALDIPALRVPTLDMFGAKCKAGQPVAVIFNARREQVYGAVFDEEGNTILKSGPYMLTEVLEAVDKAGISPVFYGDGVDAYADRLAGRILAPREERYQRADLAATEAVVQWKAGNTLKTEDLKPEYMRITEAEQKLKDGSLARERAAKMARFRSR